MVSDPPLIPAAADRFEFVDDSEDTADVISSRPGFRPALPSFDQRFPEAAVIMQPTQRFGDALGLVRGNQQSCVPELLRGARQIRREHWATERESLEWWQIVRSEERDECERVRAAIERNKVILWHKPQEPHVLLESQLRNRLPHVRLVAVVGPHEH